MYRAPGCVDICRACRYRDHSVESEWTHKLEWVKKKLAPWQDKVSLIQGTTERWHLRDKVALKAQYSSKGWQFGLVQRDEFLAIPQCPLHTDRVNAVMAILRDLSGEIPLSHASLAGRQLTLIMRAREKDHLQLQAQIQHFWQDRLDQFSRLQVEGLWLNWNPEVGRWLTVHKNWRHVAGEEMSQHLSGEFHGPGSFGQIHWPLYIQALEKVEDFLSFETPASYLELYCGIGVGLGRWQKRVARLLGVELSGEAQKMVALNAPSAAFLRGTCEQRLPQIKEWYHEQKQAGPVAVFVNPPRLGLESGILTWLASLECQRVAYMSCSVNTLARDLEHFSRHGYNIEQIIPFDFFPRTRHIENLVLMSRA